MLLPQLLTLCAAALPLAAATSPSAIHNLPAGWDNIARRAVPSPSRLTKRHGVGHVYPLADGFPAPTSKQLQAIQDQALGALPGGALPTKLDKDSITSFQLVAFNELFEVAFFNSLLYNVTHNVKGYTDLRGETKAYVVETLKAVVAQEQLHALAANAVLKNVKAQTIEPSKEYYYGVESFDQAIALVSVSRLALRAVTGMLIVPLCFFRPTPSLRSSWERSRTSLAALPTMLQISSLSSLRSLDKKASSEDTTAASSRSTPPARYPLAPSRPESLPTHS